MLGMYVEEDYYRQKIIDVTQRMIMPTHYKWFSESQIAEQYPLKTGVLTALRWEAKLRELPTIIRNFKVNYVATIELGAQQLELAYQRVQYKIIHTNPVEEVYVNSNPRYLGEPVSGLAPFARAYELACNEINKLITDFYLTGVITITESQEYRKIMPDNMYGLLNYPKQIKETVTSANRGKPEEIVKAIDTGLAKMELGTYESSPMVVLMDVNIMSLLSTQYTTGANNTVVLDKKWVDHVVDRIKVRNNYMPVIFHTTSALKDSIVIFPQNENLVRLVESKFGIPNRNPADFPSADNTKTSYIDFVLGGLYATANSIVHVNLAT